MSEENPDSEREIPAFFRFLMQALTLGNNKVSQSAFPTFVGYLTYAAVIVVLGGSVLIVGSTESIIAASMLLALLVILAVLMLLWRVVHPVVFNLMASIVVLAFVSMIVVATLILVGTLRPVEIAKQGTSLWIQGNVYDSAGSPLEENTFISIPGEAGSYSTEKNGYFRVRIPIERMLPDSTIPIVVTAHKHALEDTVPVNQSIRLQYTMDVNGNNNEVSPDSSTVKEVKPYVRREQLFRVTGVHSRSLIHEIERQTAYKMSSATGATPIVIRASGGLELVGERLWSYPGGSVQILVQNSDCSMQQPLSLTRTSPLGNPRPNVEQEVAAALNDVVLANQNRVVAAIRACLQ